MTPEDKNWRHFQRLKPTKSLSKRAKKLEVATIRHAHKFLVHRWENVRNVRRHMLGWLLLVGLLITITGMQMVWNQRSYMVEAAVPGGTYAEGIVGNIDTLNPIYAATPAERAASRLLFAPLLSYDREGRLRGDLAKGWSVNNEGTRYTINLRDGVRWHDGQDFTSSDVVFTIDRIKNEETLSPYFSSWRSIEVTAPDDNTVVFTLPSSYAPFLHALTIGILPEHLLADVSPGALRENPFSTDPVGTGPFSFRNIQSIDVDQGRKVVHMQAFDEYFRGRPKLDRFQLHTYPDMALLERALRTSEVSAVNDVTAQIATQLAEEDFRVQDIPMYNGTFALFRNDSEVLSEKKVRQAIRRGTNVGQVIAALDNRVFPLTGPLLSQQMSKDFSRTPGYNPEQANEALDEAGWKRNADGTREKDGQVMELSVVSINSGDYPVVIEELARQWSELGIMVTVELVDPEDVQQTVLRPRAYDVLIYELAIGADPDVYAYWHSSQTSQNGLNFANYESAIVDDALESARVRNETKLRQEKYKTFVERWTTDAPAIPLYQATLHYATAQNVRAMPEGVEIVNAIDRYRSVEYWTVEQGRLYTTP